MTNNELLKWNSDFWWWSVTPPTLDSPSYRALIIKSDRLYKKCFSRTFKYFNATSWGNWITDKNILRILKNVYLLLLSEENVLLKTQILTLYFHKEVQMASHSDKFLCIFFFSWNYSIFWESGTMIVKLENISGENHDYLYDIP